MASEFFLTQALSDLITDLNRRGIEYALAGGWAYSALVEPRATTDIDLLVLVARPSRESLLALMSPIFPSLVVHPAPMTFHGVSIWRTVGIRQGLEIVVDLLLAESEFLKRALARRQQVEFEGMSVPMLTLEDLILLKTLAGRLQDQADLQKIRDRGAEIDVDWAYVNEWKAKLGL